MPQLKISPAGEDFIEEVVRLGGDVLENAPPEPVPVYDAPPEPRTEKARKVRNAANALFALAVGLSLLLALATLLNSFSSVAGLRFFVEPTNALRPVVPRGALLVTVYRKPADIHPGDIITYYALDDVPDTRLTRIVDERLSDPARGEGNYLFRTKRAGDAAPDSILRNPTEILGVKLFAVPGAGYVVSFLRLYAWGFAVAAAAMGVAAVLLRRWLRGGSPTKRKRKKHNG